jgi:hypothetical protein
MSSTIDPNTLDPEQIGKLPIDRSKPFNGLSEEQVRAFGRDPEEVENARLEQNAFAAAKALSEDATLVLAAQQAVEDWEMTPAEAALGLAEASPRAHDLFVEQWQKTEAEEAASEAAEEAAWDATYLDAESYVTQHEARKVIERTQLEQEAAETKRELDNARLKALQDELDSFVASTPGAFGIKPGIESLIVEKLKDSDSYPSTPGERNALIESSLNELAAVDSKIESLKQQIDTEWRFHRKANGARDGLNTKAEIDNAERYWKQARFDQLAAATDIDVGSLKPAPSAEEESAALTAKYRDKQERSTSFHQQVAGIADRGHFAKENADRGVGIGQEKRRYREAMARAEETASYGPDAQIKSGYGDNAVEVAKSTGYGPDGTWPDELGPAL